LKHTVVFGSNAGRQALNVAFNLTAKNKGGHFGTNEMLFLTLEIAGRCIRY
jgi:hypothetical protein